jgi:uncharacterized protein
MELMIMKKSDSDKSAMIEVKVTPHARENKIEGWKSGRLCIRLRQVPEKGKANRELVDQLADSLQIAPSMIEIISGETSRLKRVRIHGISQNDFEKWQSQFKTLA